MEAEFGRPALLGGSDRDPAGDDGEGEGVNDADPQSFEDEPPIVAFERYLAAVPPREKRVPTRIERIKDRIFIAFMLLAGIGFYGGIGYVLWRAFTR